MSEQAGTRRFVSEPLVGSPELVEGGAFGRGEAPLPQRFRWRDAEIVVAAVVRSWRSTKTDRGDAYLARFWFELTTVDGRTAVVYFDRKARRTEPRWWLYSISADPTAME